MPFEEIEDAFKVENQAEQEKNDAKKSIKELKEILEFVDKYESPKIKEFIKVIMKDLENNEFFISTITYEIMKTNDKLLKFEISTFKVLKQIYDNLDITGRKHFMEKIEKKRKKIFSGEENFDKIVLDTNIDCSRMHKGLKNILLALEKKDTKEAKCWISECIDLDKKIYDNMDRIKGFEKKLISLVQNETEE